MKALKLISSPDDAPVFGHVFWSEPARSGAVYIEDVMAASEHSIPQLFDDDWTGNPSIMNDEYTKEGLKWEFVPVSLTLLPRQ